MKHPIAFLLVLFCAASVSTQTSKRDQATEKPRPDFSGTWVRDNSKSNLGPFNGSPMARAELTLVIAQHDPELKVSRKLKLSDKELTGGLVYYTDGRGETNPSSFSRAEVKSRTTWDGDKIVAQSSPSRTSPAGDVDTTETWELSTDGKTLIQTTTITSRLATRTMKEVFNRAS
jgi:hypothetical protein